MAHVVKASFIALGLETLPCAELVGLKRPFRGQGSGLRARRKHLWMLKKSLALLVDDWAEKRWASKLPAKASTWKGRPLSMTIVLPPPRRQDAGQHCLQGRMPGVHKTAEPISYACVCYMYVCTISLSLYR